MKKTDLVKNLGLKIRGQMQRAAVPGRFAEGAAALPDRREQRKLDQAAGLVPYAVKLHADLVKQLQALANEEGASLSEVTDRLIRAALAAGPSKDLGVATEPARKAPAKKAAAKKATAKKATAKKATAKKAPAKKASARS